MQNSAEILVFATALALPFALASESPGQARPNIVHIFADDLGYGSLGFTGQLDRNHAIQTPNLDLLAANGLRFNNAYASTLCAPSRANLMTGYHNGHALLDRNSNMSAGFRSEDVTVAEVLKPAGYMTGVFGKWGFGGSSGTSGQELYSNPVVTVPESVPSQQGFDEFYGYLNHLRAHSYWNDSFWTTTEPVDDDGDGQIELGEKYYPTPQSGLWAVSTGNTATNVHQHFTHDLVSQQSERFIRQHAGESSPFYMQVNFIVPHLDIDDIQHAGPQFDIGGQQISPAGQGIYSGQFTDDKQRNYAAVITRMDASIGALLNRLRDPDGDGSDNDSVLANTLVVFTSDNGAAAPNRDGSPLAYFASNGDFEGAKRDLYEGGIHVPQVAYWVDETGQSRLAGTATDYRTDLADWMATAADLADVDTPVGIDGVSVAPTLTGQGHQRKRDYLIFEGHEGSDMGFAAPAWTIIRGDLKLIRFANGSNELYDLSADPTEQNDIASANSTLVSELTSIAVADGVERADSYGVAYQTWIGIDGDRIEDATKWQGTSTGAPADNWSAVVNNLNSSSSVARAAVDVTTLGLEVRGSGGLQTVLVDRQRALSGRNEIRIGAGGTIVLDDATLHTMRWTDVRSDGLLAGHGRVDGDVYNLGTISPGRPDGLPPSVNTGVVTLDGTGELWLNGDFFHALGARLEIELGGTDNSNAQNLQSDRLVVTGNAKLDGSLSLATIEGFVPEYGTEFVLLTADGGIDGMFPLIDGVQIDSQLGYAVFSTGDQIVGRVALLGDANLDGDVDGSDFNIWNSHKFSVGNGWTDGDFSGDGVVDVSDFNIWNSHKFTLADSVTSVPEPSGLVCLPILVLNGCLTARRRRARVRGPACTPSCGSRSHDTVLPLLYRVESIPVAALGTSSLDRARGVRWNL